MSELVEVGRGGFATVYRARHDRINRLVAIKVLRSTDLSDRDRQRFERECHAMGALSWHPNVVAIHDTGTTPEGQPYLVMEYVDGGSFADRLADGPLPWSEAVRVTAQVASALAAAHAAGTLHRDLKPENILRGPFGEAKLSDFGIAVVEGFSSTTTAGSSSLTLAHVAPEVLRGQRPDERSDLYSLGSTLHMLVAGRAAFAHGDIPMGTLVMRVVSDPTPRLVGVPDELADLVQELMAKDPADRPASAVELAERLQAIERDNGHEVTVLRLTDSPNADRPRARPPQGDSSPTLAPGSVPSALAVPGSGPPPPPPVPGHSTDEATVGREPDERSRAGRTRWRLLGVGVAAVMMLIGAVVAASLLRDDQAGSDDQGDGGSGSAVAATVAVGTPPGFIAADGTDVWVVNFGDDTVSHLDGADGSTISTVDVGRGPSGVAVTDGAVWVSELTDGTVSRIDPATDEVVATVEVGERPTSVALFGDDVWVTDFGSDTVSHIDARTNQRVATVAVDAGPAGVAANAEGVWVTAREARTLTRIDAEHNTVTATILVGDDPGGVWASDDAVWVTNLADDTVARVDPRTNELIASIDAGNEPNAVVGSSGVVWVTNRRQRTLTKIDAETNEAVATIDLPSSPASVAATADQVWVRSGEEPEVYRVDTAEVP